MIKCAICGKKMLMMGYHHLEIHDITMPEYREVFPDAQITSEETLQRISQASQAVWDNTSPEGRKERLGRVWATRRARGIVSGSLKGKTYEEIYGPEKAEQLKNLRKESKFWTQISPELRRAVNTINAKKAWATPEQARKTAKAQRRKPSLIEIQFANRLELEFPKQWKYIGDGQVWIGGKNPDFININGYKLLIEAYTPYFKNKDYGSVDNYIQQRYSHFKSYGFTTIFVNLYEDWQPALDIICQSQGGKK